MASASCHVKNPCKKHKMRHERVLRPIARNRVVHQGTEASDRVKRRRSGVLARKHVMQCHGGHELLRATVAQSGSTALAVVDAVGVSHSSATPEVVCLVSRSGTKPLHRQPAWLAQLRTAFTSLRA